MEQVVIDASVVVKLFKEEEHSECALRLKDVYATGRLGIAVPSIMEYELINALKSNHFLESEIKLALSTIGDYAFETKELTHDAASLATDFAIRYDISAYDAAYLAISSLWGCVFYTSDEQLIRKTKEVGFIKHIKDFND